MKVRIGNDGTVEEWVLHSGFHTAEQFETIRKIVEGEDFDFACTSKFFEPEGNSTYTGNVAFVWYDHNNFLHLDSIDGDGGIRHSIKTKEGVTTVVKNY